MRKISKKELKNILELHKKWLNEEKSGVRADLSGADLRYTDLSGADLSGADLSGANLSGADLKAADLKAADLKAADLRYTDLRYTDLRGVNLNGTNLRYANLTNTDLRFTVLSNANLSGANLRGAKNIDLVKYNEYTSFFALQCPEEGSFIGYKKAKDKIVKLLITEDSKRSSSTSRKCRCSKAKVLSITSLDGKENFEYVTSNYDEDFVYKTGNIVEVENFDEDRWNKCSTGIHFFITRQEAVNY